MAKNKTTIIIVAVLLLSAGVILFSFGLLPFSSNELAIAPPSGCDFVKNVNDPNQPFSQVIEGSNYVCNYDRCIIQGVMTIDKAFGVPSVVMRTIGSYGVGKDIAVDSNGDGNLERYIFEAYTTSTSGTFLFNSPEGYQVKINNGKIVVIGVPQGGSTTTVRYVAASSAGSFDLSPTPKNNCQTTEVCKGQNNYGGYFNFCPEGNPNFAYCTGSSNHVSASSPQTYITDEVEIVKGQQLNFNALNEDGSTVSSKIIRVREYDCSCLPAAQDGLVCSPTQTYCNPTSTEYKMNEQCYGNNPTFSALRCDNGVAPTRKDNVECTNGLSKPWCIRLENDKFNRCDGTQVIGSSVCADFGNTKYTCAVGQNCYLDATGQLGTGVGSCKCSPNECTIGYKKKVSSNSYQQCSKVGTCNDYTNTVACANGLVFDEQAQDCVCDSTKSCLASESMCTGTDTIKSCEKKIYGSKTCYEWSATTTCVGEKTCDTNINIKNDDVCGCDMVDECVVGNVKCINSQTYSVCSKDSNDITNSCLKFRGTLTTSVETECKNNALVPRNDVGCSFGTVGYSCDTQNYEVCTNNACVCKQDENTATSQNYLGLQTRCTGEVTIQKPVSYNANHTTCYRWENLSRCGEQEVCRVTGNVASCVPSYDKVGIFAKSQYGINEKIENIGVDVTSNLGSNSNIRLVARLIDGASEVARVDTQTNSQGKVNVSFNYVHKVQDVLLVEVIVDPSGLAFVTNKTIEIAKTLDIRLNCPLSGSVDRDISCSWKILDAESQSLVAATPTIKVVQGVSDVFYNAVGASSVVFKSSVTGAIEVTVSASQNGYISDVEESLIEVQGLTRTPSLLVDSVDIKTSGAKGYTKGIHELKIVILESGIPADVLRVDGTIKTPSGQIVTLTHTKASTGTFKTSYDFEQPGTTYSYSGLIIFTDVSIAPLPFEYPISTLGTQTEDVTSGTNYAIIAVALFILVITVGIVIFARRRR